MGALAVYGEGSSDCETYSPDGDACDEGWSLDEYGHLYNWYAVDDSRELCPSGWTVPADEEWIELEMYLGMSASVANASGWRGNDEGSQLKTTYGWAESGIGDNSSLFSALPCGNRHYYGFFVLGGDSGYWWSNSHTETAAFHRNLSNDFDSVMRSPINLGYGFSVRCIKD